MIVGETKGDRAMGRQTVRGLRRLGGAGVLCLGLLFVAAALSVGIALPSPTGGREVGSGAAPGYVTDRACARCHRSVYESYRSVGMSRSFYPATADKAIEDFRRNRFHHLKSDQYFEISLRNGRYHYRQFQLDEQQREINVYQREIDWILGSGTRSRTYLVQNAAGEMHLLPAAWYTQTGSWGMAPGFDRADHLGMQRAVKRDCMFCHNAYPEVPEGSDTLRHSQAFPRDLPHGIGCQRCHGPGARHVALAEEGSSKLEEIIASVVNPALLPPRLRDDVCDQCHLQPSVAVPRMLYYGKGDYSYRPGQPLQDYLLMLDVQEAGHPPEERFEINHHPYRLRQSACFRKSQGRLGCLTCHDPHRKGSMAERSERYRRACLSCHGDAEALVRVHQDETRPVITPGLEGLEDCVSCHMPRRRAQDVVQAVMTDHRIQRGPADPRWLDPLQEADPAPATMAFMTPDLAPRGPLAEAYLTSALIRAVGTAGEEALARFEEILTQHDFAVEPMADLVTARLKGRRFPEASRMIRRIEGRSPSFPLLLEWKGLALLGTGWAQKALPLLEQAHRRDPARVEPLHNLGIALAGLDRHLEAEERLRQVVSLRPNLTAAWFQMGNVQWEEGLLDEAVESYRTALSIDPRHERSYLAIARALLGKGDREEALRYLRHGSRLLDSASSLRKALREAEGGEGAKP